MSLYDQLHPDWQSVLANYKGDLDIIDLALVGEDVAPAYPNIMRALNVPIDSIRVVIFGQDPYPTFGFANGLAFSISANAETIPRSLRNIFKELSQDCSVRVSENGDLSRWADQGVMLLNRILTTRIGQSLAHENLGWQVITDEVARALGSREVVAILLGKNAQELRPYFKDELVICASHPSPLSARRGFFGAKVFSRANELLAGRGLLKIDW